MNQENNNKSFTDNVKDAFTNTSDETSKCSQDEINNGKGMSVLAYFGILALIPYLSEKKNKFVMFHAVQGMNLMILDIAYAVIAGIIKAVVKVSVTETYFGFPVTVTKTPTWLSLILGLGTLFFGVLSVIGIINACQGKAKELPLIGKIKLIKAKF